MRKRNLLHPLLDTKKKKKFKRESEMLHWDVTFKMEKLKKFPKFKSCTIFKTAKFFKLENCIIFIIFFS